MDTRVGLVGLILLFATACFLNEGSGASPVRDTRVTPSASAAGHGRQDICTPGVGCNDDCKNGGCSLICQQGSSCSQTCSGGNCEQVCQPGASCVFSCSGGYCMQRCQSISCRTSCAGGGCVLEQDGAAPAGPAEQAEAPPPSAR
jgi:hypothetical protein